MEHTDAWPRCAQLASAAQGERPSAVQGALAGASGIPRDAANLPLTGTEGDVEAMAMYAGQSVGAITDVEPAAAIVEGFAATDSSPPR